MAVSAFMITMDNTVVTNALPTMINELDLSNSAKDWVATGYILMFSCLMIAGGRLTDVYGCRVTFTAGMTVFTGASAVCGLAPDDAVLILARVVQGGGAALALPATLVMVTVGRTDKQRSLGTIVWVGAASGATALGPVVGGFIVQHWYWGWIFLINIVPGILVILLGLVVLTAKGENKNSRVDLPGVLISATMLFALAYGLEAGRKQGWTDPSVLSVFALSGIALVCFIVVESWAPDPMMNLQFFRNRVFVGGILSQMLWGIGFNGLIFYSATFLQMYLDFSPPKAGLVMLPPSIAILVMTPLGFWLAAKLGPRPIIGGGMAAMAAGMVMFSTLHRGDTYLDLMPGVMIVGIGSALCMPLAMYVLKAVPEAQAGVASGVLNVIREVSGAFGIAIVGILIHHIPEKGASAESLETFRSGTSSGLLLGAGLVLVGGLISGVTLPSRRGWLGPKHGKQPPVVPAPEPLPEPAYAGAPVAANAQPHPLPTPGPHPTAEPRPMAEPDPMPETGPTPGPNPTLEPAFQPEPVSMNQPQHPAGAVPQADLPSRPEPVYQAEPQLPAEPPSPEPHAQPGPPLVPEPVAASEPPWQPEPLPRAEPLPAAEQHPTPEPGLRPEPVSMAEPPPAQPPFVPEPVSSNEPHAQPPQPHVVEPRYPARPAGGRKRKREQWPPPPPDGWYQPYVPDESPLNAPEPEPEAWEGPAPQRGDAW
nr:DHA2 family efflux MFS transporter permease subunit [Actinomadura barringtoniae]